MRGAEIAVKALANAGVRYVFGLVGTTVLDLLDAIYREPGMEFISVRHEQTAASMADGYARATGGLGVCLAHAGPGAANLVLGVAAAYKDSSPLIAITGNEATTKLGRDSWHELDHLALFRPITKLVLQARSAEEVAEVMKKALETALRGRPGPVHIDLPMDVSRTEAKGLDLEAALSFSPLTPLQPDPRLVEQVAHLLLEARRPTLLAGGGLCWAGAWEELRELAERLSIPVVLTHMARGALPEDHPLVVGPVGSFGIEPANQAVREADLVLAIGSSLSDITTYNWTLLSPGTRIVQVDIDPDRLGRHYPVDVGVVADARAFLRGLNPQVRDLLSSGAGQSLALTSSRIEELRGIAAIEREAFFREPADRQMPILPQGVIRELEGLLPEDAIVAVGAGMHTLFGSRVTVHRPRSYLSSVGLGAMGFAFPAAMGALLAQPGRPAVALVGDGDFGMVLQDLETAVRCRIPIKVIIFNNGAYGALKLMQRAAFAQRYIGVDFANPDFARLAELFGAQGRKVEEPGDLRPALELLLRSDGPAVLDVVVDPWEVPKAPIMGDLLR